MAGWVAVLGMVVFAALWASEPGAADPPASTWTPGLTVTTWDSERHWNYWMEWTCSSMVTVPGIGNQACYSWSRVGPTWKPCGPEIRPPQPGRINTCNIGQPGGHGPHGDNITERYTYLGRHEDRTGPTYPSCAADPGRPADTSPGNCGTWVEIPHAHCPGEPDSHPPDCPSTEPDPSTATEPLTAGEPVSSSGLRPNPPQESAACTDPRVDDAFKETVNRQPDPGHGLQPSANGYVRVPLRVRYPSNPVIRSTTRIGSHVVDLRMWVAEVSWALDDIGTVDGSDRGTRTFRRPVPDQHRAPTLNMPAAVIIDGQAAVYLRSSLRGGYPGGYPLTVRVVWKADCSESGTPVITDLGEEIRRFPHRYKVYEIRSLPDAVRHPSGRASQPARSD